MHRDERLTIKQTHTGYWVVQRGDVQLAGAMTRKGAEAERELLGRLEARKVRRAAARPARSLTPELAPRRRS